MPAKSKAQFKKMAMLYKQGKISKKVFQEFDIKGMFGKLPARVRAKKRSKKNK